MDRMNVRLEKLELEMKKSDRLRDNREAIKRTEKVAIMEKEVKELKEKENAVKAVKKFARRKINPEDLRKDKEIVTTFKSTWALRMEEELSIAAGETERRKEKTDEQSNAASWMENETEDRQDAWERLTRKNEQSEKNKIRRPASTTTWFGDDQDKEDSDISSDNLEEEEEDWKEVDRRKKNSVKAKERKDKRKRKMEETALKMKMMIGVGPISRGSVEHFNRRVKDEKLARKMAVEEFLHHYLEFNEEEISELNILETKHSKDDVIYLALDNEEHIKEIRFRRAACGNDNLVVRDFIPPQYHERYMALARKAAERRTEDPELKTQIRWGNKDVEMFTKKEGVKSNLGK